MPSTKTPRVGKSGPVSYNPLFPGGRNQDRPDNQRARVAIGDKAVNEAVKRDVQKSSDVAAVEEYQRLHKTTWEEAAKAHGFYKKYPTEGGY